MYKKVYFYLVILLVISIGFAIPGCGGGNNGTLPVTNTNASIDSTPSVVTSTPTPVLTNVSVSGYIYCNNITTEDGETVPNINVLDVSACQTDSSGNEPFVTQVANSLKEDYPEDWAKSEVQELYTQLSKTLSESKPLSDINGQLYSVYADSQSATPIPVSSDGHFDNTVLTGAADSNVKLEVALEEDSYTEVETLPSSDNISSSDATNAVLKSCPEKIFAFPGEVVIFKVYAEPGINLKSAGLRFTLNNASIGCITQPVYLCLFGTRKNEVAYGCVYIKPSLDTPVDTTITAKLNSGQSMSIFLEVIKKTASVSGTVYTGGSQLVKGYVKSLGPKACCKLNSSGQYSLQKVFMGHSRSVIATWWTSENSQTIRHREEKVINFLNTDLAGFNFGVPPTPTLTPTATPFPPVLSIYYRKMSSQILQKKIDWMQELGPEPGTKKTVDWLNNKLPEEPLPDSIAEAIEKAAFCPPDSMEYTYKNGLKYVIFGESYLSEEEDLSSLNNKKVLLNSSQSSVPTIVKNKEVLLLGPVCEDWWYNDKIFTNLREDFQSKGFIVKYLHAGGGQLTHKYVRYDEDEKMMYEYSCTMEPNATYLVKPDDFKNLDQYGVIYINAHGDIRPDENTSYHTMYIQACPLYETADGLIDPELWAFALNKDNIQCFAVGVIPFSLNKIGTIGKCYYNSVLLTEKFYDKYIRPKDFSGSIVYLNGCRMWNMHEDFDVFSNAKVFVGTKGGVVLNEMQKYSYYFFNKMLADTPMSARGAYDQTIHDYPLDAIGSTLFIDTGPSYENDSTYLPGDLTVIVDRK